MDRGEGSHGTPSGKGVEERPALPPMPAAEAPHEAAAGGSGPQPGSRTGAAADTGTDSIVSTLFPRDLETRSRHDRSSRTDHDKSDFVKRMHVGLEYNTQKWVIAKLLDSQPVEIMILVLVLCDLALVTLEVGIYHRFICINGRLVPETPGLASAWAAHRHVRHEKGWIGAELSSAPASGRAPSLLQRAMSAESLLFDAGGAASATTAAPSSISGTCDLGGCITNHRSFTMDGVRWRVEANSSELADLSQRFLARMRGLVHKMPTPGSGPNMILICEDRSARTPNGIMFICDCLSVAILTIFFIEVSVKLWVHPEFFWKSKIHLLDVVVVCMSLALDVSGLLLYYWYMESFDVKVTEMLLVTIRLWRIVRIFHNAFSMWYRSTAEWKFVIRQQKDEIRKGQDTLHDLRELMDLHDVPLETLRRMERNMHDHEHEIMQPKRLGYFCKAPT